MPSISFMKSSTDCATELPGASELFAPGVELVDVEVSSARASVPFPAEPDSGFFDELVSLSRVYPYQARYAVVYRGQAFRNGVWVQATEREGRGGVAD